MTPEAITLKIDGMHCEGCVKNITGLLSQLSGVVTVDVSLQKNEAHILFDPEKTNPLEFRTAIEEAGFDVL